MKKMLAVLIAVSMLFSTAVTGFAADAVANYPVTGISNDGYLVDEDDGGVDMKNEVDMVPYGETVYFPLTSSGSSKGDPALKTKWEEAQAAEKTAKEAAENEEKNWPKAPSNVSSLETAAKTNSEYEAWQTAKDNYDNFDTCNAYKQYKIDADAALAENNSKGEAKKAAENALKELENQLVNTTELENQKTAINNSISAIETAIAALNTEKSEIAAEDPEKASKEAAIDAQITAKQGEKEDLEDELRTVQGKLDSADATNSALASQISQAEDAVNTATSEFSTANAAWEQARTAYNNKKAEAQSAIGTAEAAWKNSTEYKAWQKAVDDAAGYVAYDKNNSSLYAAYVAAQQKTKDAEAAYNASKNSNSSFGYVYEKEAAGNMKISKKWEEGSSYVNDVEIVRKKISSDSYSAVPGASSNSSFRYLYFLAIEIDDSTSTTTRDVFGTITIEQKGSKQYAEVDEIDFDVNIEIGYDSASKNDTEGEIPITAATFKEGNGFEADSEFEFTFEADSDSFFVVNTNGQGKIVLSMDTEYDDDIGDEYPDADLYFFNGNYATFNRMGELYLAS